MVFLAGVGGMLGEPIHLVIKGDSSGGKNTLANASLALLPEGTVLAISGLSPQALAYFGEGDEEGEKRIEGVLMIDEAEGLQGAEYIIRQAMSEGRVARLTVGKGKSGAWEGKLLDVEVTASIITTTTETALHRENQTRVFDLWIDESEEQTRHVLMMMADQAAGGEPTEDVQVRLELWREALSLLEPLKVTIPFAHDLAESFPASQLRLRRDFGRVLSLVRILALLHQGQRLRLPDGSLIADLADYEVAYRLLQEVLEPTIQGLTPTALELCELHDEAAATGGDGWVKRKELEREAGIRDIASPNTVRKWCKQLSELGYWQGEPRGPFNAWYHRKLRDPKDEPVLLPRPEDLNRPDLPMGPNSLLGRRKGTNHRASEAAPNASWSAPISRMASGPKTKRKTRSVQKTPVLTTATAWSNALTGVGATMAAGSQLCSGMSAFLANPNRKSAKIIKRRVGCSVICAAGSIPPLRNSRVPATLYVRIIAATRNNLAAPRR